MQHKNESWWWTIFVLFFFFYPIADWAFCSATHLSFIEEKPMRDAVDQMCPFLFLWTTCPSSFRLFPAPTCLIQMNEYFFIDHFNRHALQKPNVKAFIWIRFVGARNVLSLTKFCFSSPSCRTKFHIFFCDFRFKYLIKMYCLLSSPVSVVIAAPDKLIVSDAVLAEVAALLAGCITFTTLMTVCFWAYRGQ